MKKNLYLLFWVSIFAINTHAQVVIGSLDTPHRGTVLELKSDTLGFLPPRVALSMLNLPDPLPIHVQGMVVFNTTDNPDETLQMGLYYNSGTQWIRLSTTSSYIERWFYMPSVVFDVSKTGTGFTKDLYQEYKDQIVTPNAKNSDAPASIAALPGATDLNYYVADYDHTVFDNIEIDDNGKMTYDIIGTASDATFLNIIFVIK
jgi:hypothetical protein